MDKHEKAKALLLQARSALGGPLFMPLSASQVLYDLVKFEDLHERWGDISANLVAGWVTRNEFISIMQECYWWAEEWHGWGDGYGDQIRDLRTASDNIESFIRNNVIDLYVFTYNPNEEVTVPKCTCPSPTTIIATCPVHGPKKVPITLQGILSPNDFKVIGTETGRFSRCNCADHKNSEVWECPMHGRREPWR